MLRIQIAIGELVKAIYLAFLLLNNASAFHSTSAEDLLKTKAIMRCLNYSIGPEPLRAGTDMEILGQR